MFLEGIIKRDPRFKEMKFEGQFPTNKKEEESCENDPIMDDL
jgi:hypothetical protein